MAYQFDATGDYIDFTKGAAATDLSQISYSYHFIKDAFTGTRRNLFWSGGSFPSNYHTFHQYTNSDTWTFTANWNQAGEPRWRIDLPSDDVWTQEVITYDFGATSNDPAWYRNGSSMTVTEVTAPTSTAHHTQDDGTITIGGGDAGGFELWLGKIAEFAIWNRILTAAEAAILGDGFSPLFIPNGLVFYAPLIRGAQDLKSGNSGTISNAAVYPHPRIIYPSNYNIAPFAVAAGGTTWPGYYGGVGWF